MSSAKLAARPDPHYLTLCLILWSNIGFHSCLALTGIQVIYTAPFGSGSPLSTSYSESEGLSPLSLDAPTIVPFPFHPAVDSHWSLVGSIFTVCHYGHPHANRDLAT